MGRSGRCNACFTFQKWVGSPGPLGVPVCAKCPSNKVVEELAPSRRFPNQPCLAVGPENGKLSSGFVVLVSRDSFSRLIVLTNTCWLSQPTFSHFSANKADFAATASSKYDINFVYIMVQKYYDCWYNEFSGNLQHAALAIDGEIPVRDNIFWTPSTLGSDEWIQIDLKYTESVTKVIRRKEIYLQLTSCKYQISILTQYSITCNVVNCIFFLSVS